MRRGPTRAIFPFSSLPPLSFPLPRYITFLSDSPRQPLYFFSSILRNKRRQNRGHLLSLEFFKVAASYGSKYGFDRQFSKVRIISVGKLSRSQNRLKFLSLRIFLILRREVNYRAIGVTAFPNQLCFLYFRHSRVISYTR